jgi:hypothetical protein
VVLEVTANMKDGKGLFAQSRVYMPVAQRMGRGNAMGRGPYEKSGMIVDTSLPVGTPVLERFEISVPGEMPAGGGGEIVIRARLWYLPFGTKGDDPFLWRDVTVPIRFE